MFGSGRVDDKVKEEAAAAAAAQQSNQSPKYMMTSLRYWDVTLPPTKRHVVAGRLVPTLKSAMPFFSKKRRITIEVYRPSPPETHVANHNDEQQKRFFGQLMKGISSSALMHCSSIGDDDLIAFRILKAQKMTEDATDATTDEGDWDSHSISSMSVSTVGGDSSVDSSDAGHHVRWKERYRCRFASLDVVTHSGRTCDIKLGAEKDVKIRTLHFESNHELQTFLRVVHQMKQLQEERGHRLAENYKLSHSPQHSDQSRSPGSPSTTLSDRSDSSGARSFLEIPRGVASDLKENAGTALQKGLATAGTTLQKGRKKAGKALEKGQAFATRARNTVFPSNGQEESFEVRILVEIVSATNLPISDILSADPYVKAIEGNRELHRTKILSKTLNPVWTLETGSLFLINSTVDDYFQGGNFVTFEVKDYDTFGSNEQIGTVEVSKEKLLAGTGERVEFEIVPPGKNAVTKRKKHGGSLLALRYRPATDEDVEFLESFVHNDKWHKRAVYSADTFLPPRLHRKALMRRMTRKGHGHVTEYRVKPTPDPESELETTWLTEKEINFQAYQPSRSWIESGSGSLGKVFVEILCCDDLPNLDLSVSGRDKTDAFVCLVFEDSIVHTDVINDSLSPRWMPWSQRAFVLNIIHPSSQLMIGVFDHDKSKVGGVTDPSHDSVGRAVGNLTNCSPGTLYTLKYTLYEMMNDVRVNRGTVTLRLRVEFANNRKALLGGLKFVSHHDVSVAERQYYRTVHHTLTPEKHPSILSLSSLTGYFEELESYLHVLYYTREACLTVFLWRGHYPVHFRIPCPNNKAGPTRPVGWIDKWTRTVTLKLPLHSIVAFAWGIALARDVERLPSFLVFSVGWFLLATMEQAGRHPSPLHQPRSYLNLLGVLLFNYAGSPSTIAANEKLDEIKEYNTTQAAIAATREEVWKTIEFEQSKYEAYIEKETNALEEEVDISTKVHGLAHYSLVPFRPVLLPLQRLLHSVCVGLRVVSSIVVWRESYISFWIVTFSLLLSFVLIWVPWAFILSWLFKISVWVLLGPWMKLLDIFYFQKFEALNKEQRKAELAESFRQQYSVLLGESFQRRVRREHALKMKVMRKYMFGKYIMRVPVYKEEKFLDDPLPESFAEKVDRDEGGSMNVVERKYGQMLKGDMIPSREWGSAVKDNGQTRVSDDGTPTEYEPLLKMPEESYSTV